MSRVTVLMTLIFLSDILVLSSCQNQSENQAIVFPKEEWLYAPPPTHGIDTDQLLKALTVLKKYSGEDGIEETLIIRSGVVVYAGDSVDKAHNIYSSSKSFTSTALGLLIEQGKCTLDTKGSAIDSTLRSLYSNVTLRHFTTMTSGYSALGNSRWNESSEDWSWTPYKPTQPYFEPGTAYAYWDEAQMMFGRLLTQIARQDLHQYLKIHLTDKIDMGEWTWGAEQEVDGITIRNGCTGITINATQLARLGHLFLNNGNWNGTQVINENWVAEATRPQVEPKIAIGDTDRKSVDLRGRYGYNWWVRGDMNDMPDTPPKTFYTSGFNNNMCFVIPEWDMVVVRMGEDGNPKEGKRFVYNEFFKVLATAIKPS